MERIVGTTVRGLRAPIIRKGDDIAKITADTVENFLKLENVKPNDKDIVAITESIVARAQGNYATVDDIAKDIEKKFGKETIGVIHPILSRNRFAINLKGFARGAKKIILMLSYPADEVGNHLIYLDKLDQSGINPWADVLTEEKFRAAFGYEKHTFTGIDYIDYYKELVKAEGAECEVIFANNPTEILKFTKNVINCDIHTRKRTKNQLIAAGGEKIYSLDDILCEKTDEHGYNEDYGLLGTNKATEESVKLFPRDCKELAYKIQGMLMESTGKTIEVMVYGDGAFKDPVGKIWELADPVVSPGYTAGLEGTPNEVKIKYLADNNFSNLSGDELKHAIEKHIHDKDANLTGKMEAQGTTPRRLTDLLGSLCDLTSGSGDKGTPIIYIQGYFDNYSI